MSTISETHFRLSYFCLHFQTSHRMEVVLTQSRTVDGGMESHLNLFGGLFVTLVADGLGLLSHLLEDGLHLPLQVVNHGLDLGLHAGSHGLDLLLHGGDVSLQMLLDLGGHGLQLGLEGPVR